MKKLLAISFIAVALAGCSFVEKAKENIKDEVSTYEIGISDTQNGFVYRENGKFYYKPYSSAEPKEIGIEEVATYTAKVVLQ